MVAFTLSDIVIRKMPELYCFLKEEELASKIVLQYGIEALTKDDILEIIEATIRKCNNVSYH